MRHLISILITLLIASNMYPANLVMVNEDSYVHLLCHEIITYMQVGDPDKLIAESLEDYPNVVRFKAMDAFDGRSSITIICNNRLYCFEVVCSENIVLNLDIDQFSGESIQFIPGISLPLDRINDCMAEIQSSKQHKNIDCTSKDKITFSLDQVGVRHDLLFVRLTIVNHSNIVYKTDVPLFLMQDKRPKRAANRQEYPLDPFKVSTQGLSVQPGQTASLVVVFKAFTIPAPKTVRVILKEDSQNYTGRDLELEMGNKAIRKAVLLKS